MIERDIFEDLFVLELANGPTTDDGAVASATTLVTSAEEAFVRSGIPLKFLREKLEGNLST